MFTRLMLFITFSFGLYSFGERLEMLIFERTYSSIYGSYAFLITFLLLFVFSIMKKSMFNFLIYLGIPLLGIVLSLLSYNLLKVNLMTTDILIFPVISKRAYLFCVYLICSIFTIIYDAT